MTAESFFTCFYEFNVTSGYSPQFLSVAENDLIDLQGKGSCESPKRDKWRYASVPYPSIEII